MEKTVGTLLRLARKQKKLKVTDVREKTRIPVRYIEALENDHYDILPGETYVKGFIRNIADAVDLNPREIMDVYHHRISANDVDIHQNNSARITTESTPPESQSRSTESVSEGSAGNTNGQDGYTRLRSIGIWGDSKKPSENEKQQKSTEPPLSKNADSLQPMVEEKKVFQFQKWMLIAGFSFIGLVIIIVVVGTIMKTAENKKQDKKPQDHFIHKQKTYNFNGKKIDLVNIEKNDEVEITLPAPIRAYTLIFKELSEQRVVMNIAGKTEDITIEKYSDIEIPLSKNTMDLVRFIFVATEPKQGRLLGKMTLIKVNFETGGLNLSQEQVKELAQGQKIIFEATARGDCFIQVSADGEEQGGVKLRKQQSFKRVAEKIMQINVGNLNMLDIKINGKEFPRYAKSASRITLKWQADPLNNSRMKLVWHIE